MHLHDNTERIISGKEVMGFQVSEKNTEPRKGSAAIWEYASMGIWGKNTY